MTDQHPDNARENVDVLRLAEALLADDISDADRALLEQHVTDDPVARREYVRFIYDSLNLYDAAGQPLDGGQTPGVGNQESGISDPESGIEETAEASTAHRSPLTTHHSLSSFIRNHNFAVAVSVAFLAVVAIVSWMAFSYLPGIAEDADPPTAETSDKVIAWLVNTRDVAWTDGGVPASTKYQSGQRLAIEEGLVAIRYATGAKVIIEGPAQFVVGGTKAEGTEAQRKDQGERIKDKERSVHPSNSGYLAFGKLVARCDTAKSKGFIIDTPSGFRVQDLATEFRVESDPNGAVSVQVYEGEVTYRRAGGAMTRLVAGSGVRLVGERVVHLKADHRSYADVKRFLEPQELIANGGFDQYPQMQARQPSVTWPEPIEQLGGSNWVAIGTESISIRSTAGDVRPYSRPHFVQFFGDPGGGAGIAQTLTTTPGVEYLLTAHLTRYGGGVSVPTLNIDLFSGSGSDDGSLAGDLAHRSVRIDRQQGRWRPEQVRFIAKSGRTTVRFMEPITSASASVAPCLDGVSITQVAGHSRKATASETAE
ncbi:MAG: hypothetical protein MI757_16780 [Pirellulales bacterium]|nr:hypothetical protein [Pirellulales bacterium]